MFLRPRMFPCLSPPAIVSLRRQLIPKRDFGNYSTIISHVHHQTTTKKYIYSTKAFFRTVLRARCNYFTSWRLTIAHPITKIPDTIRRRHIPILSLVLSIRRTTIPHGYWAAFWFHFSHGCCFRSDPFLFCSKFSFRFGLYGFSFVFIWYLYMYIGVIWCSKWEHARSNDGALKGHDKTRNFRFLYACIGRGSFGWTMWSFGRRW